MWQLNVFDILWSENICRKYEKDWSKDIEVRAWTSKAIYQVKSVNQGP